MLKSLLDIRVILLGCVTIGLAPFTPEPHIWGKLMWVLGGANGMKLIDWGDFLMHGIPWILLLIWIFVQIKNRLSQPKSTPQ